MSDRFITNLPGKLKIEIDERGNVTEETEEASSPVGTVAGQGLMSGAASPDDVFRRAKGFQFAFYDLATRYNGNGYGYQMFLQPVNFFADHSGSFLEASPFESTDGHTNCLRLPFTAEWLYLDAILKRPGIGDRKYICGANKTRPFLSELVPGSPVVDSPKSQWRAPGVLAVSGANWHLQIQSGLYYQGFDTSDENRYKITNQPSRIAARVEFKTPETGTARVYLMPTAITEWLFNHSSQKAECFGARRFPVLPDFLLQTTPQVSQNGLQTTQGGIIVGATPDMRTALIDMFEGVVFTRVEPPAFGNPPFSLETATRIDALSPFGDTLLAGVIVIDKTIYYIWHQNLSGFAASIYL